MASIRRHALPILAAFFFSAEAANAETGAASGRDLDARLDAMASALDQTWLLVAAALVLLMQIGFMMLEAGAVRTKNAVSVAQKNLVDIAFSTIAFAAIGFMLAFGAGASLVPIGWDMRLLGLSDLPSGQIGIFVFQAMFCGTAATIVSGAVAERMRLRAYVVVSVLIAGLIYPVFTHWSWGAMFAPTPTAFLANAHFVDFAGSIVVHATGAWMALASILVLGARIGRFDGDHPARFGSHSAVLSSAGALILLVGWIGFNGGSTHRASADVATIVLNTILAGAAGGAVGYGHCWLRGPLLPERTINGMVGGLVAITAGCHMVSPFGAVLLGAAGASAANAFNTVLEKRFRLDDAVGAIGVHGAAGIVGALGLALLAPVDALPAGSRLDQLAIQAAGIGVNFLWAFGLGFPLILALSRVMALRVAPQDEIAGLNESEHGVRMGTGHLERALETFDHRNHGIHWRLPVEPGDDAESLAIRLNRLMDELQGAEEKRLEDLARGRSEDGRAEDGPSEAKNFVRLGEMTNDAILLLHGGTVRTVNAAATSLFGAAPEALSGRSIDELGARNGLDGLSDWLRIADHSPRDIELRSDDGRTIPVELRLRSLDLDGHRVQILNLKDISEKRLAEDRIFYLALHDTLTDLPNRELFNRRLASATAPGRTTKFALLLVDIDRFKDINDIHGHPSGDAVLAAIAERLQRCVREGDTVARIGGDEFALIQCGLNFVNQAADLAHRLLRMLCEPLTLPSGATIRPRASIGVAVYTRHGKNAEALFQNADLALYAAKQAGRNGFRVFEPGMGRALRIRQELELDLSQAIDRDELELHFQPRLDVATATISSFEALLRWTRDGEAIAPARFIPIAEAAGLILPIGEWVIHHACHIAAREFPGIAVSVNVSPRQFIDPDLVPMIEKALHESGLPPSHLEVEITEGILIEDDMRAVAILSELRHLGVRIALDDFGTGYSSLSYLTRFSFDTIKIDRSFVQATDEKAWHIIRSVLTMSKGLNAATVAEGVETEEQLRRLVAEGCSEVQGFLIGRPENVSDRLRLVPSAIASSLRSLRRLPPARTEESSAR